MKDYSIKSGYQARQQNAYYEDYSGTTIYQPDIYTAAIKLARKMGVKTIVDIGSGNGEKLIPYKDEFKFVFVDFGSNLKVIEKNIGSKGNRYIDQNFEEGFPKLSDAMLSKSAVICSDVVEHIIKPDLLLKSLVELSSKAPIVMISTPDRLSVRGVQDYGPPQNPAHVREWSMEELDTLFRSCGLQHHVIGKTRSSSYDQARQTSVIVSGTYLHDLSHIPEDLTKNDVIQNNDEYLTSPIQTVNVGALIADAHNKGYTAIEAQEIFVNPTKVDAWPEAGVIRRGHGLIGALGAVRKLTINKSTANPKIYPFRLTMFIPSTKSNLLKHFSANDTKLVDTGHLADDYLLETLVGWDIIA